MFNVIDLRELEDSFMAFKMNGFDQIHETILNLLKCIFSNKYNIKKFNKTFFGSLSIDNSNIQNQNNFSLNDKNNFNDINTTNINPIYNGELDQNSCHETNEKPKHENNRILNFFKENDIKIAINLFNSSLKLLNGKLNCFDIIKLLKYAQNIFTLMYSISNILNNLLKNNKSNNIYNVKNILITEKLLDELIEVLSTIHDKGLFNDFDLQYAKIDKNSIHLKSLIFRSLLNCIILIKTIRDSDKKSMVFLNYVKLIFLSIKNLYYKLIFI